MSTVHDVANYFRATLGPDVKGVKLHLLCTYAQGVSLGYLEKPLFSEEIIAGPDGPSIPALKESEARTKHDQSRKTCSICGL